MTKTHTPLASPRRILLIRPSALGDVCRTVPVLVSLRDRWPDARIDWLVQEGFEAAIASHPALTLHGGGPMLFPRQAFRQWANPAVAAKAIRWMNGLRSNKYELVVDAQGLARSGLFAWWTGAPVRVGYSDAAELGWLGVNRRVNARANMHTVDRMLRLVEAAGATAARDLRLYTALTDRAWVASQPWANASGRYVVIAPTSRWTGKRWPIERHAAVVRTLLDDSSLRVTAALIVGSASERDQCGALLNNADSDGRIVDLLGKTTVGTLMSIVERASLIIGSDSAAAHMAVGFDRPLVALYGPTRVDLVGPYGRSRDVLQHVRPGDSMNHKQEATGRALMARISVEEVVAAARERLT